MAGERILYVDDDPANRMLVNRVLASHGYEMEEAVTGEAGLEKAQAFKPDLILMDINLPDIDGYQATGRIRQMEDIKDTPVIALTANAMVGDREKALAAGCDGYISKPVDIDELPTKVAAMLERGRQPDALEQFKEEQEEAADTDDGSKTVQIFDSPKSDEPPTTATPDEKKTPETSAASTRKSPAASDDAEPTPKKKKKSSIRMKLTPIGAKKKKSSGDDEEESSKKKLNLKPRDKKE